MSSEAGWTETCWWCGARGVEAYHHPHTYQEPRRIACILCAASGVRAAVREWAWLHPHYDVGAVTHEAVLAWAIVHRETDSAAEALLVRYADSVGCPHHSPLLDY